jgi:hypothetical protein
MREPPLCGEIMVARGSKIAGEVIFLLSEVKFGGHFYEIPAPFF